MVLKAMIYIYQATRFMRLACCRFYPSCSDYCLQAIDAHGLIRGVALTVKRLLKCHPWHPGGIDLAHHDASTANNGEA